MDVSRYNYWLYSLLTILFCWIIYNLDKSNWTMLSFYLISCFYLALYFIINLLVKLIINKKYKKKLDNLECNIQQCHNDECDEKTSSECDKSIICLKKGDNCIKNKEKCKNFDNIQNKINIEKKKIIDLKLQDLDYYKIRGKTFKKHINYYLIILIITFFIYVFIIVLNH
jgi:hypothetical protein